MQSASSTPAWSRRDTLVALGASLIGAGGTLPRPARAEGLTDADLMRTLALWRKHSDLPVPMPDVKDRALLLDGKVLKKWLPPRGKAPVGAMAMVVTDLNQAEMWLGSADGEHMSDHSEEAKLIAHHLPKQGDEMFRWYGYVDLPSPFTNRHFLIRTTVNPQLSQTTNGQCWERTWRLEEDGVDTMRPIVAGGGVKGLSTADFESAIYVPANLGGWVALQLPNGQTLFGYHASSSLGGDIPDKLVNRFVMLTLGKIMDEVRKNAGRMKGHYVGAHHLIMSGTGGKVPLFSG